MRVERRIVFPDGTYGADAEGEARAAEVLRQGRAVLAEARSLYGLGRRDIFTARRAHGTIIVSNVKRAPKQSASDELAEARIEVLEAKAATLRGGVR